MSEKCKLFRNILIKLEHRICSCIWMNADEASNVDAKTDKMLRKSFAKIGFSYNALHISGDSVSFATFSFKVFIDTPLECAPLKHAAILGAHHAPRPHSAYLLTPNRHRPLRSSFIFEFIYFTSIKPFSQYQNEQTIWARIFFLSLANYLNILS